MRWSARIRPRFFLASNSGHSTKTYLKLLHTVESQSITAIQPTSRPRKIELGSVELTILPQAPEDRKEENNNSVGIRLKYGSFSCSSPGTARVPSASGGSRTTPTSSATARS